MAASAYFDTIQKMYIAYFGRPADPIGLEFWANKVDAAAGNLDAVINGFAASSESQALFGNKTSAEKINAIYTYLFNRPAEPAGLTYWVQKLDNGEISQAGAMYTILSNAGAGDVDAIANKLAVAKAFTAALDTNAEILGYSGAAAADVARNYLQTVNSTAATKDAALAAVNTTITNVVNAQQGATGQSFTLATTPDNVVGTAGNDTINGYVNTTAGSSNSTLTAADVINGGAGTDSLKLTVEGTAAGALPNASISNVEQFFIRDVATVASAYNFGTINGETQVWAETSTNAVQFDALGTGATVGVKGNNVLDNLGNVTFNMATATDAVSIAIDGGVKDGSAGTGTLITIGATAGTATAATIASTGAANTVGAVTLSGGTNTVKTLTINATTDLTAALVATDFAADAKMVVTGAGKVNVGANFDGDTIDASANTGGLTVSTTTGVTKSVTGSSAADAVTLVGSLTSTGKIDLGAGNDKLLAGAGAAIVGTNVIDGGAGSDSISASLINAANAAAIKNFELLDITAATTGAGLDVELITGSTITGLTLSGGAGAATVNNVAAGVGLTVDGANTGLKTVNLKGASTNASDSFAVTFDGAKVAGAAAIAPNVTIANGLHLDYVESVSVASGGADNTWNGLLLDGGANNTLQTLTITGAKNLNLTTTATAFGKAPANAADTTNGLKLIDGSAATGKLVIDLTGATLNTSTSGLTVKGGSADDTITLVNSVLVAGSNSQKFVVDAGAGNDTIIVAANGGTLTGGAGNDTFDVTLAVATGVTEATAVLTTITDLAAGDKIDFAATSTGAFTATKVTLGAGVTNLDQAMAAAVGGANTTQWFQYGSNTYVISNDADAAFDAGDTVVKITGLVDLSASTMAGTVLTIA